MRLAVPTAQALREVGLEPVVTHRAAYRRESGVDGIETGGPPVLAPPDRSTCADAAVTLLATAAQACGPIPALDVPGLTGATGLPTVAQ